MCLKIYTREKNDNKKRHVAIYPTPLLWIASYFLSLRTKYLSTVFKWGRGVGVNTRVKMRELCYICVMVDLSKDIPTQSEEEQSPKPLAFIRLELSAQGKMSVDMNGAPEMLFKMVKAAMSKPEFAGVIRGAITMIQQDIALESQVQSIIQKKP